MKKALIFLLILIVGLEAYSQKNPANGDKEKTNRDNSNTKYTEGASGVKRSISYSFSSDATDADPGNGTFSYNATDISKASYIYLDNIDLSGDDQTKWYKTWDDTTGAMGRGQLNIVEKDGKNINVFYVTGLFKKESGYWKIPVEYVSGNLPSGGTTYFYVFNRIAKKKDKDQAEEVKTEEVIKPVEQVVVPVEEKKEEIVKPVEQVVTAVEEKKPEIVNPVEQIVVPIEEKKPEVIKPSEIVAEVIPEKKEEKPVEQVVIAVEEKKEEVVKPVEQVVVPIEEKKPEIVAEVIPEKKEEMPVEQIVVAAEEKKPEVVKPVEQVVVPAEEKKPEVIAAVEDKKEEVVKSVEQVNAAVEEKKTEVVVAIEEKKEEVVKPVEQVVTVEEKKPEVVKPVEQVVVPVGQKNEEVIKPTIEEVSGGRANRKVEIDPVTHRRERPQEGRITQTTQTSQTNQSQSSTPVTQTNPTVQTQTNTSTQSTQSAQVKQSAQTSQTSTQAVQQTQKTTVTQTNQNTYTQNTYNTQKNQNTYNTQINQNTYNTQNNQNTYNNRTSQTYQSGANTQVQNRTGNTQTSGTSSSNQNKQVTPTRQEIPATQTSEGTLGSQGYHSVSTYTNETSSVTVRGRKWWHGIIEAGYGLGMGEYGMNNFRLNFINAVRIGKCSTIGFGIGYRQFFDTPAEHPAWYSVSGKTQIPVFLDLRTTFSTRHITPYLAFGIGNSFRYGSSKVIQEGLYICPSGGIWFNLSDRFAFFAGAAYELQKLEFASYSDNVPYKKTSGSLSINLGISF